MVGENPGRGLNGLKWVRGAPLLNEKGQRFSSPLSSRQWLGNPMRKDQPKKQLPKEDLTEEELKGISGGGASRNSYIIAKTSENKEVQGI